MANFIQQFNAGGITYDLHDSEFIIDTRTASGAALTGVTKAAALFDGMQITFWMNYAAASNATLNLTLADGTTTGAIPCYYSGTTRLGTHYAAGNVVHFTYRENVTIGSTTVARGWWGDANYSVSDTKVTQNAATTANNSYRVLLSNSATNNAETAVVNKAASLYYNPSSGILYSPHINTDTKGLVRQNQTNGIPDITVKPQISTTRANRLAFLPADQIIIEKTTDGGTTWEDAGVSDTGKLALFSETRGVTIGLPLLNGVRNINCGLRITITGMKYSVPEGTPETEKYNYWNSTYVKSAERYCQLSELYFFVNSITDGISLKVERATGANSTTWVSAYDSGSTFALTGWSGSDYVRFTESTFGGGVNQTGNYWNCRLTFFTRNSTGGTTLSTSSTTSAQSLIEIRGYGTNVWTSSNNYMKDDHLYTWNSTKQVTFPSTVTASGFYGSGANLTSLNASNISSGTLSTARLPDAYGDTKNPYSSKTAHYVLAAPSNSAGAPSFRALVADDIPSITTSKISDFPTSMTPTSHTHGNISNGGTLEAAIATGITAGDRLVITTGTNHTKIAPSTLTFGNATDTYLRNDGTWAKPEKIIYVTDHQGESGWSGDRYTLDAPYNDKTAWDAFIEELTTTDIGAKTAICVTDQNSKIVLYYNLDYNYQLYGSDSEYANFDVVTASSGSLMYEDDSYHFALPYLSIIFDRTATGSDFYSISVSEVWSDDVAQVPVSDNNNYRILLSGHASSNYELYHVNKTSSLYYNPSTQVLTVPQVSATSFSGSGASITSLNASNLSSGTVPVARMPDLSSTYIPTTQKGATSGIAELDSNSKLPVVQSNYLYGKCTTGGSTAAKTSSITGYTETSIDDMVGVTVFVGFANPNTASSPTLNINSTSAHPIVWGSINDPMAVGNFSSGLHSFTLIKVSSSYYWYINEGRDTIPEAPTSAGKYLLNISSSTGSASWSSYTPVTAPTTGTLSLDVSGWSGNGPYSHSATISGTTANSKIDLQPDSTVLAQMTTDGTTALYIENNNGTLTAWAMGAKPTAALSIQYTRTEVA